MKERPALRRGCEKISAHLPRRAAYAGRESAFPAQTVLTVLYRLVLDCIYVALISPYYASIMGFTTNLQPLRYLVSLLAVCAFAPAVSALLRDFSPSSILLSGINYLYFIPLTSYYGCHGTQGAFFLAALVYWALLLVLQTRIPKLTLKPLSERYVKRGMTALTVFSVLFVFALSGIYTGFRFTLDVINVYEIRAEAEAYDIPTLAAYVMSSMTMILAVLLVYWMRQRNLFAVLALVVTFLFRFSFDATKSIFFFLLLLLASCLLYRDWMLRWLPGLLVLVEAVPFVEHALGGHHVLSLFFRRVMYVPVQISEHCAMYASLRPLNLFQQGIMGKLSFESIYSANISKVIGAYMGSFSAANNGLLGDLYLNLPAVPGILLMPLILIVCLRLFDLLAGKVERKYLLPFCVYYAFGFINSSWSTVLLSHGFLIACLLLYLFPKEAKRV